VPILFIGIASSVYAAVLFPMIPLVVNPKVLGSAYGICSSTMNIGLALGPILVGGLTFQDQGQDAYFWVTVTLLVF